MTASSSKISAMKTSETSWKLHEIKMPMGPGVAQGTTKLKPFMPTTSMKNLARHTLTQPVTVKGMNM